VALGCQWADRRATGDLSACQGMLIGTRAQRLSCSVAVRAKGNKIIPSSSLAVRHALAGTYPSVRWSLQLAYGMHTHLGLDVEASQ